MAIATLLPVALASTQDADVTVQVGAGTTISMEIPTDFSFSGSATAGSSTATISETAISGLAVEDLRTNNVGFMVTAQAGAAEFCTDGASCTTTDSNITIPAANVKIKAGAADVTKVGVSADLVNKSQVSESTYAAMSSPVEVLKNGVAQPTPLTSNQEPGKWTLNTDYQVDVPAYQKTGHYKFTVTYTLVDDISTP